MAIATDIYEIIKSRILDEVYKIDSRLSEGNLAKDFDCSRTPIREALQRLEKEGFVVIRSKSGTYVNKSLFTQKRSDIEVRAYIEGLSFRLCIEKNKDTDELVCSLGDLHEQMKNSLFEITDEGMRQYSRCHLAFHKEIVIYSENPLCLSIFEGFQLMESPSFIQKMTLSQLKRTHEEHVKIIEYIASRNPKGEEFMIDHLYKKKYHVPESAR